jgi:5,5'-dehydrodivanillate O-demethylase oxygenase subunit
MATDGQPRQRKGKTTFRYDPLHTGPGTLAGRYLRGFWQPIFRTRDLKAGAAVPIRVMSEELTLFRGAGGKAHIVESSCAHRGGLLSLGWVEEDCLRCSYHGWKYDATGQCIEQPAEEASFTRKMRIRSCPAEEYLGLIFGYFGEGDPPPLERFPEFEEDGLLIVDRLVLDCNYFWSLENSVDPVHVPFVHGGGTIDLNGQFDLKRVVAEESEWGISVKTWRPSSIASDENSGLRVNFFGMPNIVCLPLPPLSEFETDWRNMLIWRVPVDDQSYATYSVYLVHLPPEHRDRYRELEPPLLERASAAIGDLARGIVAGEASTEGMEDALRSLPYDWSHSEPGEAVLYAQWVRDRGMTYLQDALTFLGQGRVARREKEHLGQGDVGTILLRKLWVRELQALAEGRPLKQWSRPAHLVPKSGVRRSAQLARLQPR